MSTGQLLDRTIALYRQNFLLFTGIAAVGPAAGVVYRLLIAGFGRAPVAAGAHRATLAASRFGVGLVVGWIVLLAGLAIAHGATVRAVAAVHLGRDTSIAAVYGSLRGRFWRLLRTFFLVMLMCAGVAALIMVGIFIVVAIMLVGLGETVLRYAFAIGFSIGILAVIAFVIFYVRYALAIQACVVEDLGVRASLKRSVDLSEDSRWRIGGILFAFFVLSWIFNFSLNYLALRGGFLLSSRVAAATLSYTTAFISGSITAPLSTIGSRWCTTTSACGKKRSTSILCCRAWGRPRRRFPLRRRHSAGVAF